MAKSKTPAELDLEIANATETKCTTCGRPASSPYRRSAGGKIVEGCIDDVHTGHLYGSSLDWHNRPTAKEFRKTVKARIKEMTKGAPRSKAPRAHMDKPGVPAVGQQFKRIGEVFEVVSVGRDKKRTVVLARRVVDRFGKETLIDQRRAPAAELERDHLFPVAGPRVAAKRSGMRKRSHMDKPLGPITRGSIVLHNGARHRVWYARGKKADIYRDGASPTRENLFEVLKSDLTQVA